MSDKQMQPIEPVSHNVPKTYFPTESDWRMIFSIGENAFKSGMIPTSIKSAQAASIIALKARELDLPIMMGFSHIHIINGKPTMSAELMQALARKNLPGLMINILESSDKLASIEFIRPEKGSKPFKISFSIEDAEKAKLLNKDVWKQYPSAMLWSRCVSAGLRRVCPEALLGVSYTPEELGAEVNESGEVVKTIVAESRPVEPKKEPAGSPPPLDSERLKLYKIIEDFRVKLEWSPEEVKNLIKETYQVTSAKELSEQDLYRFINLLDIALNKEPEEAPLADEVNQTTFADFKG